MKKLFKGGKIDSRIEFLPKANFDLPKKNFNFFLLVAFLSNPSFIFSQNMFNTTQVPINGFCKFKNIATGQNYSSFFPLNYNNDSYTDILLYSPLKKKINILTGNENGEFSRQDSIKVPFQFSSIRTIFNKKKEVEGYAFASRRDRTAGIFRVSRFRRFSIQAAIKFNSYPENISLADVNGNGKKEILISGSAFDGLSLLYLSGRKLEEKKIEERTIYTDAVFIDLNNDDIPDIAGFNLITNSLEFFYNYGDGNFRKVRSIPINGRVSSLQSFDMNSDNYEDLIFVKDNSIMIFYGDFRSSFENSITINPLFFPDKIIVGDFNKDGKIDIAYINYAEGILSVIFAKNGTQFYPEIIYLKKNDLKDIIPFYSKFIGGIAGLNATGDLFTITRLSSFSENVEMVLGAEPSAITFFDNGDDGITDFCFLDELSNSLIAVVRNSAGIPKLYYSFPLFQNHSEVTAFNISSNVKGFYCYSFDRKLIEAIVVDFDKNKIERKSIYAHGELMDLKVVKDSDNKVNILAVYRNSVRLGIDVFKYYEQDYANENYEITIKDLASNITFGSGEAVYFWQKTGNNLRLLKKDFNKSQSAPEEKFSLSLQTYFKVTAFTGDLLNKDKDVSISFLNSEEKNLAVISTDKYSSLIKENEQTGSLNVENKTQLFLGEMRFNGLKKLFVYYPKDKIVDRFDFLKEGKEIIAVKIASAENLNRYFIKNMNVKNYHLVFTQRNESPISIIKIIP